MSCVFKYPVFTIIVAVMSASQVFAQETPVGPEEEETKATPETRESAGPLLGRGRNFLGRRYRGLTEAVDNLFGTQAHEKEVNSSYLKLVVQPTWFQRRDAKYDVKLKGKIDLPNTQRRFRLFFDSDPDEERSLVERNRSVATGEELNDGNSIAGIEFLERKQKQWKHSVSLGAKLKAGFNPIIRLKSRRNWVLNAHWSSYFRQEIWHLRSVGWGETTHLEFTRKLKQHAWFHLMTEIEYQDDAPYWQYIHSWRVDQKLNDTFGITGRIGFTGKGSRTNGFDSRFINFGLRTRIYQDWAFLHFTPEVFYDSTTNYQAEWAFTLKLELLVADN